LEAIKKTAYRLADRTSIIIKVESESVAQVIFTFKPQTTEAESQAILREFSNELMDQELRFTISEDTKGIRNLILAHAFSKSSLIPES
jgi:His-Xaa-Ser system protein HxsD